MDIGIVLYKHSSVPPIHRVYMVKPTPRHTYFLYCPNLESHHEDTYSGVQKSESTQLPFFIFNISLLIIPKFMFLS